MSRQTQAMQDDDTANPGMLWVLDGETLFKSACAGCHADGSMKGVAATYPKVRQGKLLNLEQRVNLCRVEKQNQPAWRHESKELLSVSAWLGHQSRGQPLNAAPAQPFLDRGRALFERRQGQLNLACAHCHEQNPGRRLAGTPIPQGHPTGYPIYRLEWQGAGSLQRRLRNCLTGMRAELYDLGAPELVELELFLTVRAQGMKVETPAVRP